MDFSKNIMKLLLFALVVCNVLSKGQERSDYFEKDLLEKSAKIVAVQGGKDFGLAALKNVKAGETVFCISDEFAILSSDINYFHPYVKDLPALERLKAYLLYYKFMEKSIPLYTNYIKSLPTDLSLPVFWPQSDASLFENLSIFQTEKVLDFRLPYGELLKRISNIKDIPKEMLTDIEYLWATSIVNSRSFLLKDGNNTVYALIPYIDLANHWPNPKSFNKLNIQHIEGDFCLISNWDLKENDEVMIEYANNEDLLFFMNYGFVTGIYSSSIIEYPTGECKDCIYSLKSDKVNTKLIEMIAKKMGGAYFTDIEPKEYFEKIRNREMYEDLIGALMVYRKDFVTRVKDSDTPGIRELRRLYDLEVKKTTKSIYFYAITKRAVVYQHLKALDKDLIFAMYKLLFKKI